MRAPTPAHSLPLPRPCMHTDVVEEWLRCVSRRLPTNIDYPRCHGDLSPVCPPRRTDAHIEWMNLETHPELGTLQNESPWPKTRGSRIAVLCDCLCVALSASQAHERVAAQTSRATTE